jgi:hypothetical protein
MSEKGIMGNYPENHNSLPPEPNEKRQHARHQGDR